MHVQKCQKMFVLPNTQHAVRGTYDTGLARLHPTKTQERRTVMAAKGLRFRQGQPGCMVRENPKTHSLDQ